MISQEESLKSIIAEKRIRSVFQPIVSLENGDILGYEALSRIVGESAFENTEQLFVAAKQYDLLWPLDLLCRTRAFEAVQTFITPDFNKKIFVNINPNIMTNYSLEESFSKSFLEQYGISPTHIIFEITERTVIDDMSGFKETIEHYKNQDYKIAIDDTGAGYSGLNLISDVDPNYIKLDMNLIRNIHLSNIKSALVKGMVEFSKVSNIKLIAEGIETYPELEAIIKLGVHYGQGHYFQKPETAIQAIQPTVIKTIETLNEKSQLSQQHKQTIDSLSTQTDVFSPDDTIGEVYTYFRNDPECLALAVVKDKRPVGLISQKAILEWMEEENQPSTKIANVMNKQFLSVDRCTPINTVSHLAMARSNHKVYERVIVTENNLFYGTVTVKTILETLTD